MIIRPPNKGMHRSGSTCELATLGAFNAPLGDDGGQRLLFWASLRRELEALKSWIYSDVQERISRWLAETGVVFVEAYKPRSGRGGDTYLIRSLKDLSELAIASTKSALLFLARWRPLKAVADSRLYERLSLSVRDGVEIAIGEEAYFPGEFTPDYPETIEELRESIEDYRGTTVLVGQEPSFPDRYWEVDETEDTSVVRGGRTSTS